MLGGYKGNGSYEDSLSKMGEPVNKPCRKMTVGKVLSMESAVVEVGVAI